MSRPCRWCSDNLMCPWKLLGLGLNSTHRNLAEASLQIDASAVMYSSWLIPTSNRDGIILYRFPECSTYMLIPRQGRHPQFILQIQCITDETIAL